MRFWWLTVLVILAAVPVKAADITRLEELPNCDFTTLINEPGLRLGAVVLDLQAGTGCVENLDVSFQVASVPKIFIAGTYYDMLVNGQVSTATRQIFTNSYLMAGRNACLNREQLGQTFTNGELIDLMINCSDNAATWMLMDSIGWGRVQNYVDGLAVEGIGQIAPYSEVDRIKLTYLDNRWSDVPRAMASQFYRRGWTDGLLEYFDHVPERPTPEQYATINQHYYDDYNYNTLTPRALATYFIKLHDDLLAADMDGLTASALIESMLHTQRLFSTQAFPGTIYIGGKNGFDRGVLAEANLLFNSLTNRVPTGLVIVFTQYETLDANNSQLGGPFGGALNDVLLRLSPYIRDMLFPGRTVSQVQPSPQVSSVVFHEQAGIEPCWWPYRNTDYAQEQVPVLENCFRSLAPRITFKVGTNLAMGLILRGLNGADTRLVFMYTAPDGRRFSYQEDRQNVNQSGIYWYHPIDMAGMWQIDIYLNLQHVISETVIAQQ